MSPLRKFFLIAGLLSMAAALVSKYLLEIDIGGLFVLLLCYGFMSAVLAVDTGRRGSIL